MEVKITQHIDKKVGGILNTDDSLHFLEKHQIF